MSLSTDARTRLGIATTDFDIGDEIADAIDSSFQTAATVANTPAGSISAVTVQAAINELATEKAALAGATFTGEVVAPDVKCTPGAAPATPAEGQIYCNSTDHHFYGYNGTTWVQLDN